MNAMPTPQKPRTPAQLLATAGHLTFRATTRDRGGSTLGVLVDASGAQQHLAVIPEGTATTWSLSSALPTGGIKPVLLYESAANILRGGHLNEDGSIDYQGGSYVIESAFDGKEWTAKVSGSA
jgi:hypothetical protein